MECIIFLQFDEMLPIATVFAYLGMFRMSDHLSDAHGVLLELLKMEGAFPDRLFVQIVLTVPIASPTAERSFSTMKCVKTYLRSTIPHDRSKAQ